MILLTSLIFILLTIFLLHIYISWDFDYWKKRNVPFLKPVPFFGNIFRVATFQISLNEYLREVYQTVGEPYVGIFLFGTPTLLIRDEELLKNILIKDFNHFPNHAFHHSKCELSGNFLVCLKSNEWNALRKKFTAFFTSGQNKNFLSIFDQVSDDLLEYLKKHCEENSTDTKKLFSKYSTDLIGKAAFAINANSFIDENAEFPKAGHLLTKNVLYRFFLYFNLPNVVDFFKIELLNYEPIEFLRNVLQKSIEMRENLPRVGNDFIDLIVELKRDKQFCRSQNFSGDKILAQAILFFLGGYETTSSVLAFSSYELAMNPDVQKKARTEIEKNVKKHGGVNFECLQDMAYLEMICMETLRMYPPLAVIDRKCAKDYEIPGTDVVIEKGTTVLIPLLGLHFDSRTFPNPEKYDPERFADKNEIPFIHMPFGKGQRACFGNRYALLNFKLAMTKILANFEIKRSVDTPEFIEMDPTNYLLTSKGGIPVNFNSLGYNRIPLKSL